MKIIIQKKKKKKRMTLLWLIEQDVKIQEFENYSSQNKFIIVKNNNHDVFMN